MASTRDTRTVMIVDSEPAQQRFLAALVSRGGWRSVIAVTGSDRFPRIRIGVGAPPPGWDLKDWVLSGFGEDQNIMNDAFEHAAQAADCFIKNGIDLSMNRYIKR